MRIDADITDAVRHRLLEGVLLRLARRADAGDLVLRGGMLLRHWFGARPRPALDIDLVAPGPVTVEDANRRYLSLFAGPSIADGVLFDAESVQLTSIWQHTSNPGVRFKIRGRHGGNGAEIQIDITGGPPPRPEPIWVEMPMECGLSARVRVCRPESVVAQKVQALCQLGMHCWRPKDLDDLRLLLERVPLDAGDLRWAIGAYLADFGRTGADARALFGPDSWWGLKFSSARWLDFADGQRKRDVPRELALVAAGVGQRLAPILEGLP